MDIQSTTKDQTAQSPLLQWIKQHESILTFLLDASCIIDTKNSVVYFNTAFSELVGLTSKKIQKTPDFCTLIHLDMCKTLCPSQKIIQTKKNYRLDEVKGQTIHGLYVDLIVSGSPIFDTNGEVLGALMTLRDVTAETRLQKKYDERKKDASMDGLTLLNNKIHAEELAIKLVKNSFKQNLGLHIIMSDIDHFKKINDTYGHQAGDEVLFKVATIIHNEARDSDITGRFGGEEFFVALINSTKEGGLLFAERVRKKVESTVFEYNNTKIPVTISSGTAWSKSEDINQTYQNASKTVDPNIILNILIQRADQALYYAKNNGRNKSFQFDDVKENIQNQKKEVA